MLSPRNGYICKSVVNQQFALICVRVNQNSPRSLSLATMAGEGISVIEMRMLADIESNIATRVHSDFEIAGISDSLNGANPDQKKYSQHRHQPPLISPSIYGCNRPQGG